MGDESKIKDTTKEKSFYTKKSEAGKGDFPRNVSKKYWDNFDKIDWGHCRRNKMV